MLLDEIVVLILPYFFVQALHLRVDILADLLLSTGHKLEGGGSPFTHVHVYMCRDACLRPGLAPMFLLKLGYTSWLQVRRRR